MKKIFILITFLTSFNSLLIGQTFDGVAVSGNYLEVVKKFKAKKYKQTYESEGSVHLKGKNLDKEISLLIMYTPKSKQAYSFTVIFEELGNEILLESEYDSFKAIFNEKYGEPSLNEKDYKIYKYFSIWEKETYRVTLAAKKEKNQILIGYYNLLNENLNEIEKKQLMSKTY